MARLAHVAFLFAACGGGADGSPPPRHLALGFAHTCALVSSGVYCWGKGSGGELGDGSAHDSPSPVATFGLSRASALGIASGQGDGSTFGSHTCAILADRSVSCWGVNIAGNYSPELVQPTLVPTPIGISGATALAIAKYDNCALLADGTVASWGSDFNGGLGDGRTDVIGPFAGEGPARVKDLTNAVDVAEGGASGSVGCAVRADGSVWCWGNAQDGEIGNGTTGGAGISPTPVQTDLSGAVSVVASYGTRCAILRDASVACWGNSVLVPTVIVGVSGAKQVAVGASHTCALVDGGGVECWGSNDHGQLGRGTTTAQVEPPGPVIALPPSQELGAGYGHTCALANDETVWCWGKNDSGQIGDGTTIDQPTPTRVASLP